MSNIGLGLDYQQLTSYGVKFSDLVKFIGCPLSHFSIVAITNPAEAINFKKLSNGIPIIHHFTGVAPGGVYGVDLKQLKNQTNFSVLMGAKWCVEDLGIWNIGPYSIPYFAPPVLSLDTLNKTISEIELLQSESSVLFLPEVPSCSFVAGDISLGDFFSKLVQATKCEIVLDISHVFSYAIYHGVTPRQALDQFPLRAVKEFHVAGGSVHPSHEWRYRDTHSERILKEVAALLEVAIPLCPNLKAITYEIGVGIPLSILESEVELLNNICLKVGFTANLNC